MPISKAQIIFLTLSLCFGLLIASFIASALFMSLSGFAAAEIRPWSIWQHIDALHSPALKNRFWVSLLLPHGLIVGAAISLSRKPEAEYGDAHWATWQEISKAGLFSGNGLILGKYRGRYLVSDQPTHAMLIAPTRSGKGVGLVIPNLLNWSDSILCLDVKNENFRKTAGYRHAHGHEVFMWSPLDPDGCSHRYNPLDAISSDPHQRVSDIQVIANILIKNPPKSDPVWASEARALFVGLALYVMDSPDMPSTIGSINRLLGTEQDLGEVARHIVQTHSELSDTVKKSLMNFANKAAKERSGVKSSLNQAINLWDNPVIDAATSTSDFSIKDLRRRKTSIYVGVLTGQIGTLAPLLRIFFEQVITILSMREPGPDEPYKVLMMLDEFHMLGEMASMTSAFTLLAGYNCRVLAVVQGLKWLDDVYGRDKRDGILSCCAHQIFFAANDLETATYVSNSCGERTVKTVSTSQRGAARFEPPGKNISSRARPLISKEKVKQLSRHQEIIITESSVPIKAEKIAYYQDKGFSGRQMEPPKVPKLRIINYGIPQFDIPVAKENFIKEPKYTEQSIAQHQNKALKSDLSSWLDDAAAFRKEQDISEDAQDETALIMKLLSGISDGQ